MTDIFNIPPHGYVRYVDHLGSDQRIVEAARVSYMSPSKGEEADKKLLFYLYKNRHTSPFEQCNITFNIKMPIFVMRQFVRHRTFRLNEWSGRYSELKDEFYYPETWRAQDTKNKQGSVEGDIDKMTAQIITEGVYNYAHRAYKSLLELGVAKELARIVLPVSIYTEIYVNVDLHNFLHFLNLRWHPHAQKEVQDIARGMWTLAQYHFPWTFEAWARFKLETKDTNECN